jgi:acyl-CoA synthetase (AMP-forming)/AMP-acid ligase II
MLAAIAERHADLPAVLDGDAVLTFPELLAEARRVAGGLQELGVRPGDRVAVWVPNCWQWMATAFGIWELGAVIVPIGTPYPGIEAASMLSRTEPRVHDGVHDLWGVDPLALLEPELGAPRRDHRFARLPSLEHVVVVDPGGQGGAAPGVGAGEHTFDGLRVAGDRVDPAALAPAGGVHPDAPCEILFTSGTTGRPKAVVLGHWQMLRAHWTWATIAGLRAGDRFLIVSPYAHGAGINVGLMGCMSHAVTNVPVARFDPVDGAALVERHRVTALLGPPALYQHLLEAASGGADLSSLRVGIVGTASVPTELIERIRDGLGLDRIVNAYGLTEGGVVAMTRDDDTVDVMSRTSGRALPDVELRIAGDDDDGGDGDVPTGEPGEILVRSYALALDYWGEPEVLAGSRTADGWFRTGDIGTLDAAGNVSVVDRKHDMFIVGGFNAYPAEIEDLLSRHPDVGQVAVVGVPDARLGEVGIAYAVPSAGRALDPGAVVAWARGAMANYKVPRAVVALDALPLNANGKVDKVELRRRWADGP